MLQVTTFWLIRSIDLLAYAHKKKTEKPRASLIGPSVSTICTTRTSNALYIKYKHVQAIVCNFSLTLVTVTLSVTFKDSISNRYGVVHKDRIKNHLNKSLGSSWRILNMNESEERVDASSIRALVKTTCAAQLCHASWNITLQTPWFLKWLGV